METMYAAMNMAKINAMAIMPGISFIILKTDDNDVFPSSQIYFIG